MTRSALDHAPWPAGLEEEKSLGSSLDVTSPKNDLQQQVAPCSLRISVTDRCQLRCHYCMPVGGVSKLCHTDVLRFEEILQFVHVLKEHFGLTKVRLTGGEPLIRPGLTDLVRMLGDAGVQDVALTTNGQQLAHMAAPLKRAGLCRVNVSIDSLDPATFGSITRGGELGRTLAGIDAALRHGLSPVKVNAVVMRGVNSGEVEALMRFGLERGCQVRFLELMPIGCARRLFDRMYVSSREVLSQLRAHFRLVPLVYEPGVTSRNFSVRDSAGHCGVVGLISSESRPFCRGCTRLRLTSTGRLVSCLARGAGPDIRGLLRRDTPAARRALRQVVADALRSKKTREVFDTATPMVQIGG